MATRRKLVVPAGDRRHDVVKGSGGINGRRNSTRAVILPGVVRIIGRLCNVDQGIPVCRNAPGDADADTGVQLVSRLAGMCSACSHTAGTRGQAVVRKNRKNFMGATIVDASKCNRASPKERRLTES